MKKCKVNDSMLDFSVNAETLKKIYKSLENESNYFDLDVKPAHHGIRDVILKCKEDKKDYFMEKTNKIIDK